MNKALEYSLKAIKKGYTNLIGLPHVPNPKFDQNPNSVSNIIIEKLLSSEPCMITRFGSTELACISNYMQVKRKKIELISYIQGRSKPWWWDTSILIQMQEWSGFFPATVDKIEKYCELMLTDITDVDVLGSWQQEETIFENELKSAIKVRLMYLDPFWSKTPWSKALKGKKILIVHPFSETIKKQYGKRKELFVNQEILPEFDSIEVIKAVQSLGKGDDRFIDWFDALEYMKAEIEKKDFDICLIGCGAYGLPLAAHVKRMGKKAVHMGGSLQLLFGIRGKRWEVNDPHYEQPGNVFIDYFSLPNNYWVRPSEDEKPKNHAKVENSCYW